MGKKVITHVLKYFLTCECNPNSPNMLFYGNKSIDLVPLGCILHTTNPVRLSSINVVGNDKVEALMPNRYYQVKTVVYGVGFYYVMKMIDEQHAVIADSNQSSASIFGEKFRWGISKSYNLSAKQLLLSNSKNNMLIQVGNDPLNIMEGSNVRRTDMTKVILSRYISDKINLWDYDADNPIIQPHIFRLMVEDKLILTKPKGL